MRKRIKGALLRGSCGLLTVILLCTGTVSVSANAPAGAPYPGYEYNSYEESVGAPVGYIYDDFVDSAAMELEVPLSNPTDMCHVGDSYYVLDSDNGRVLQLDAAFHTQAVYNTFRTPTGEQLDIVGAMGLDVDNAGRLYIADTKNTRILVADNDGTVRTIITRPDDALTGVDLPFRVVKVRVSSSGEIMAIADSINLGIFVFDQQGVFLNFEGSNPIYKTSQVILSFFLRRFRSREQIQNMVKATPLRILNFCLDEKDYLYTVSFNDQAVNQTDMVRRLNHRGSNIIEIAGGFGDFETPSDEWAYTKFSAVDVDKNGFLYLVDSTRGRVFQYSQQGYLISAFGAYGDQKGTFGDPVQVLARDGKVYVLDGKKNGIHIFNSTQYVQTFHQALDAFDRRDTDTAFTLWKEVLQQNTNSIYPYYGLGMVYDSRGEYTEAMRCFKLAGAQEEYSSSFREYRKLWIGRNYLWVVLIVVAAILCISLVMRRVKKKMVAEHGETYAPLEQKWLFPVYTLFHPVDGFDQFKYRKELPSYRLTAGILAAWYTIASLEWFFTGFSFSKARPADFNPLATFVSTVGVYLLFVIANWSLCTLFSGKGSMKDICATCAYALVPHIGAMALNLLLTNVLTAEEASFVGIVSTVGLLWSAFLLLGGLYSIHQFTFGQTLLSVVATVIGMGVIMLLMVLFYTLLSQATGWIQSVILELSLR